MKIAVILPALVNSGPTIVARDIINNIVNDVELIDVFYFDEFVELEFPCNTQKISFWESIDFDKYDIIHTHMLRPDAYVWKNKNKIKKAVLISTLHQDIKENLKGNYNLFTAVIFEKIWLYLLRCQFGVVTLTETMRNQYSGRLKNEIIKTIYNGRDIKINENNIIPDDDNTKIENLRAKYKLIGAFALLTRRKGIHEIINALIDAPDFALLVIGDGKEKDSLIKLAKENNVFDRCLFLGYVNQAYRYLSYIDIYAMPSISEGFSLSVLEAANYKRTIICSDIPLFREIFSEEEVVFFELNNPKSLARSLHFAIQNKEMLSTNVFRKVQEKYSVKAMCQKYMDLYKSALNINM